MSIFGKIYLFKNVTLKHLFSDDNELQFNAVEDLHNILTDGNFYFHFIFIYFDTYLMNLQNI